ncbi:MAG: YcjF family protein [Mangrovicoccus sp.]
MARTTKTTGTNADETATDKVEAVSSETEAEATTSDAASADDSKDVVAMDTAESAEEASSDDMVELPSQVEIDNLIKGYVIASMASAAIPVPPADTAAIIATQVKMIHGLAKLYDVPFTRGIAQNLVVSLIGGVAPLAVTMGVASLAKTVPVIGTFGGMSGMVILAGASTYATGQVLVHHFENGGTLVNLDTAKIREEYRNQLRKGKELTRRLRGKSAEATAAESVSAEGEAQPA